MYYFYQPHYHLFPYGHTNYQSLFQPMNPDILYQVVNRPNFAPKNSNTSNHLTIQNVFPPVNPDHLYDSAKESRKLMSEASKVLDKFATSKDFDTKLMDAAQRSDNDEVNRLIHSIGITSQVDIEFNPDSLRLEFKSKTSGIDCCRLLIVLRWR